MHIVRAVSAFPEPAAVAPEARAAILAWYAERGRPLAFRRTRDPYAVLVSEAMAQQTQAARAAEAWERFMARFPTVEVLAAAHLSDVVRQWAGLGYDRRALALWQAARMIVGGHGGQVPADVRALQALPGVGPYTARAVAALAFGLPVGAVDVNVRRVLGRITAGDAAALRGPEMQAVADASVPPDDPGGWTHALMDIGATVCKPRNQRCGDCPARPWCRYDSATPAARHDSAAPPARHAAAAPPADPAPRPEARPRGTRERQAPFASTNRWLRGRIMTRLRATPDGAWAIFDGPLGAHDAAAIEVALVGLERDGLIELDSGGRARLRVS